MQTLAKQLNPKNFDFKKYISEFNFSENFRFNLKHLRGDLLGGLTSAIVALPLALGFGLLAYNGNPEGAVAGLYGAIFTGILASLFGGTPQQITGPTGGMTVILTTVYIQYGGAEALLAACIIAGVLQVGYGFLKLGKYVHLVPYPVTVGFTNGIAILIFLQQIKTFETAPVIALITMGTIFLIPRIKRNLPKSLIGLIVGTLAALLIPSWNFLGITYHPDLGFAYSSAVKVIGEIPSSLRAPHLPAIPWETWKTVFPAGFTISLLGAIETLLASVVADNATDTTHNSNKELIGQGIGNFTAPFFGGVAGTGAIVRTMVNVRAGGSTRLSGIIHGFILVLVVLFLGSLASQIPLAALAGVLMMTALGMVEMEPIKLIPKTPAADAAVMMATILITVFTDLITAVEVGMVMAAFLFVHRMSEMGMDQTLLSEVKSLALGEDVINELQKNKIAVIDVEGPLFFGAAKSFVDSLEKNFDVNIVILEMHNVPIIDTTGAVAIENIVERLHRDKKRLIIVGLRPTVRKVLYDLGVTRKIGIGNFLPSINEAIEYALTIAKNQGEKAHLASFVPESLILLDLEADNRNELFEKMIAPAVKAGIVKNKREFLASLNEREESMPTTIGHGVAVPHARSGGANSHVVVVFARLKQEFQYDLNQTEKVKLVFMVSTGSNEKQYLNVLRMIASNIGDKKIYERLLLAEDKSEIHHVFSEIRMNQPLSS